MAGFLNRAVLLIVLLYVAQYTAHSVPKRVIVKKGQVVPFDGVLLLEVVEKALIKDSVELKNLKQSEIKLKQELELLKKGKAFRIALNTEIEEENKSWKEKTSEYHEYLNYIEPKYMKAKDRENLILASNFVGWSLFLSMLGGVITYSVLNYTESK